MRLILIKIVLWMLKVVLYRTHTVVFIQGKGGMYKPTIGVHRSITDNSYIIICTQTDK